MGSRPPTNRDHVNHFLEMVEEHDGLCREFPVEQRSYNFAAVDEKAKWARRVRAFSLRKFTMSKRDDVHVVKVLRAVEALAAENGTKLDASDLIEGYQKFVDGGIAFGDPVSGGNIHASDVIEDLLYGGYLHGDYDRWQKVKRRGELTEDTALWQWTMGAEDLIRHVAAVIHELEERGVFSLAGETAA